MPIVDPPEYCAVDGVTLVCDANHTGSIFWPAKRLFAQHNFRMKQRAGDATGDRNQIRLPAEHLD
jgi:hypothetical protein